MIELRDFLKIFIRQKRFLIAGLCIGLGLGVLLTLRETQATRGTLQLSLYRENNPSFVASTNVTYDGYDIIETSRLYGERLGDFLGSDLPQLQLSHENISAEITNVLRLSPQDVKIELQAKNRDAFHGAVLTIKKGADIYLRELSGESNEAFIFQTRFRDIGEEETRPWYLFWVFGAAAGLILGATAAFMREYLAGSPNDKIQITN